MTTESIPLKFIPTPRVMQPVGISTPRTIQYGQHEGNA
jgi:hypothetical protein